MSVFEGGSAVPPEEALLASLGSIGNSPAPAPAGTPPPAPETPAAAAPALAPLPGLPAAPAPDPNAALAAAVRDGIREAMPAPVAAAPVDKFVAKYEAIIANPDASDEMKEMAQLNLDARLDVLSERAQRDATLAQQKAYIDAQRQQAADAVLGHQESELGKTHTFTADEIDLTYKLWNQQFEAAESNGDETTMAVLRGLTLVEFMRRAYGEAAIDGRRKVPGAPPTLSIVQPPANSGAHPIGHLASDASGGAPINLNGTGWVPPQRDGRGPSLEDARQGALKDPRFASGS